MSELFQSKKFRVFATTVVLAALNDLMGWGVSPETVEKIVAACMAWVVGQGIADHGKEAEKVRQNAAGAAGTKSRQ